MPPSELRQLFYVSRCLAPPEQVEAILEVSRARNAADAVTGALLFTGGCFAQVLEGPAGALAGTMGRIAADGRHDGVRVLLECGIEQRRFAGWAMASTAVPGAEDLLDHLLQAGHAEAARIERLIGLMFAQLR